MVREIVSEPFDAVKVFSVTKYWDRTKLGDQVTAWIQTQVLQGGAMITGTRVLQSSDRAFHCLTIVIFYQRCDIQSNVGA